MCPRQGCFSNLGSVVEPINQVYKSHLMLLKAIDMDSVTGKWGYALGPPDSVSFRNSKTVAKPHRPVICLPQLVFLIYVWIDYLKKISWSSNPGMGKHLCKELSYVLSCIWFFEKPWLPCPQNSLGKNTGVGCHFLLQWIFPTQGSNLSLLRLLQWQANSSPLNQLGSPVKS